MYEIKKIENKDEYERGRRSTETSFLQSWEYGQLQKDLGYEPLYLGIFESGNLMQSLLFILFRARRGTYLFCPYGVHSEKQFESLIPFLKKYATAHKVDFIRLSPLLDETEENKALFKKYGFKGAPVHMVHPELLWLLDISGTEDEILAQMRKNTRYGVRRAEKDGVSIKSGATQELLDTFYAIHEETAKRQGFVPYSKKFLDAQRRVFAPLDKIKIFIGMFEGKAISGAVIMYYGDEGAYHHGASLTEYNKIPASYLIQWEAIKEAKSRNMHTYNFWGVVDNAPKHPWAGLSFFKKGFGGEGRQILHCQDLPITKKYWLNWIVETIRRIKRGY
ncbi:MAG: peptidoglycan bridge formation glycyltransferase FemA/FemB family protein [Candidatus Peregrinibacteria bacterium]|nr:peptidoglycan bridge formation glycyltransferase FemA/FemB family protein [Candidatus Peregrinibacteria bacterium]MDZ4244455.1 peptidoglycan bridge formation glycyltransferase FemA/FemB family protein [Candidatus Gracilibacteria bacterium]